MSAFIVSARRWTRVASRQQRASIERAGSSSTGLAVGVDEVERVDRLGAERVDPRRPDVEPGVGERPGQPVEQSLDVVRAHLDHGGRTGRGVDPQHPRRHDATRPAAAYVRSRSASRAASGKRVVVRAPDVRAQARRCRAAHRTAAPRRRPSPPSARSLRLRVVAQTRSGSRAGARPARRPSATAGRGVRRDDRHPRAGRGRPRARRAAPARRWSASSGSAGSGGSPGERGVRFGRPARRPDRAFHSPHARRPGRGGVGHRSARAAARGSSRSPTAATTRSIVAGSSRSRRVAVSGSSRWCRTSAVTRVDVGSAQPEAASRSRGTIATPASVWSPG